MSELKTLKDMNLNDIDGYNEAILKAEAVKWVKKYRKQGFERVAVEFMQFFNLTEEDLQND